MSKLNLLKHGKRAVIISLFLSSFLFAGGDRYYEYAKVTYSEPIYDYVYDNHPNRICKEVRYKVRDDYDDGYYSSRRDDSLGLDTLVGTTTGVVIGSQIGKGNGRVAAQIVGGLLGAKISHEIRNNYRPQKYDNYRYEIRTECYDEPTRQTKTRVLSGYKNYFVYNGIKHYKITNEPIKRVQITHTIDF
ncbi:hypothetical protein CRV08_00415 [Halarcobacter ebronensis]|uniref:Glycine zipper 2TM domain-containing protein n=1 Tax=Halarcobacter ebronensis TaxID=1462615 RepID=A0A4Q0YLR7_9BACT|nr:glycine zipper 2TM domain-containing protein [Halarcobacter ebronensis]RXJ70061.1 hypothetical protein CRV08_00415 [Halarcobacter ebronensis]